ncbi:MAG: hypothetical protein GY896_15110 [Gammaproteobacteria bacterium]|nr:hypothetical protein [Gammaproteobacteria bacterium]
MRHLILLSITLLAVACSSRTVHENQADIITRTGAIIAKEDVNLNEVEAESRVNTSVHASVSTGRGVSIGLGFLLSPFFSADDDSKPVRYEVDLQDGGQITIFHESRDFEVDDCVEITSFPDEQEHPPTMKRNKDGCTP